MKILKALLLLCAFITLATRLFVYNNESFLSESISDIINTIGFVCAILCIILALIWIIVLKVKNKDN